MRNKRKGKKGDVALKIDISKAYDRVDWRYLNEVLIKMGFSDKCVAWMRMCVESVSYNFAVNDNIVGPIIPGRGLRQGDPLSPYLFILCAEGLSSLLRGENRRGTLHGCRVGGRAPSISHLFFADDSLLFCQATREECSTLKSTLNLYERASGQVVNYSKSGLFFSTNVSDDKRADIRRILGVSNQLNTSKYLDLPSLIGKSKVAIFHYICERLWNRLQGWRNKKLSKAGKEVLIKSAAQAIPAYCMSTFLLPDTLLDELHKILNSFWWGHGTDPKKGVKWEKWESLCKHKNEGGMGFHNLHVFNIAMLGKLCWRIQQYPNALLSHILKAKYFPRSDFFEAGLGSNPSYTWRGIFTAKDLVRRGTRWKIGDGTKVHMWGDPWINDDKSFHISSPPVPTFEDMVVNDFFVPGTRSWNREIIEEVFSIEDATRILKTTPSPSGVDDRMIWHFTSNGYYTVKSAYHLAIRLLADSWDYPDTDWHLLWKVKVPPKIKSFFWRLCKGWVAVRQKLSKWYPGMSPHCPVCVDSNLNESVWHLFVDCPFAVNCWKEGGLWDKIDRLCYSVDDHASLFLRILKEFDPEEIVRVMAITWGLWRHRNQIVWESTSANAVQVVHSAMLFVSEWKGVRMPQEPKRQRPGCERWHPPQGLVVKINVDASFFSSCSQTGLGMVARDSDRECLALRTLVRHGLMSVDEGEAWGVSEALRWAVNLGLTDVIIETDSQRARNAVACPDSDASLFGDFIEVCRKILLEQPRYVVCWVCRNANMVAHVLARNSRDFESSSYWVELPEFVDGLLDFCRSCV